MATMKLMAEGEATTLAGVLYQTQHYGADIKSTSLTIASDCWEH